MNVNQVLEMTENLELGFWMTVSFVVGFKYNRK